MALRIVAANEAMNFALAGMFNATFAGLPFVAFGLAVARSEAFPHGWGGLRSRPGPCRVLAGGFQAISGRPTVASLVMTIIGPTVTVLWMITMRVLMARALPRS